MSDVVVSQSFCRLCVASCGVLVESRGDEVLSIRGDPTSLTSHGYTCPKGRALGALHHDPNRLDGPLMRVDGELVPVSWDTVLDDLAEKLLRIVDESGPHAVHVYFGAPPNLDTSGALAANRFVDRLGTRSRYTTLTSDCASKYLVPQLMLGHGVRYRGDLVNTRLALFVGANPVVAHGHTWAMSDPIQELRRLAGHAQIWVMDPRRTETAQLATGHLACRPGTDYAVLAHLVRELLAEGADHDYLERYTADVDLLRDAVASFDAESVAALCRVDVADLAALVDGIRRAGPIVVLTGTGVTMGKNANVVEWLTIALMAVTGSLDRPGGMIINPGYLSRSDRTGFGPPQPVVEEEGPPSRPDLPHRFGQYSLGALLSEVESGHARALLATGGNLMGSAPQPTRFATAVAGLEVHAITELVHTAQTRVATHVLGCTAQLERADVTHRIQNLFPDVMALYTPAVMRPTGDRKPMWWVYAQLGRRMGWSVFGDELDLDAATDDDVLDTYLDADKLAALRSAPEGVVDHDAPLHGWFVGTDQLPDRRIQLAPPSMLTQLADPAAPVELGLAPRRQLRHTNTLFSTAARQDGPDILVSPEDARECGVADGQRVRVSSPYGSIVGTAVVDQGLVQGAVSIPHGFTGDDQPNVCELISHEEGIDPYSGMLWHAGVPLALEPA